MEREIIKEDGMDSEEVLSWRGALKHIKKNSVELQHEIKYYW